MSNNSFWINFVKRRDFKSPFVLPKIPALQQESHFVLLEGRKHPLPSLEKAGSLKVVYQLR